MSTSLAPLGGRDNGFLGHNYNADHLKIHTIQNLKNDGQRYKISRTRVNDTKSNTLYENHALSSHLDRARCIITYSSPLNESNPPEH